MKVLPCEHCKGAPSLAGVPYAVAMLRDRTPYTLLSWPVTAAAAFTYGCAVCKRTSTITPQVFASLPRLEWDQLLKVKLADVIAKDLKGAGITDDQIGQLAASGASLEEILQNR